MLDFENQLQDRVIFPREDHTTSIGEAGALFIEAYSMDLANDLVFDGKQAPEAKRLYSDAFDAGCIEAGVNLMRILVRTSFSVAEAGTTCLPLQNRLIDLSERLHDLGHPVVPYYEALTRIVIGGLDSDYDDMYELAKSGNKYAITFFALSSYLFEDDADEDL